MSQKPAQIKCCCFYHTSRWAAASPAPCPSRPRQACLLSAQHGGLSCGWQGGCASTNRPQRGERLLSLARRLGRHQGTRGGLSGHPVLNVALVLLLHALRVHRPKVAHAAHICRGPVTARHAQVWSGWAWRLARRCRRCRNAHCPTCKLAAWPAPANCISSMLLLHLNSAQHTTNTQRCAALALAARTHVAPQPALAGAHGLGVAPLLAVHLGALGCRGRVET